MKQIYVLLTYKDKIIFGKCFNATTTYIWVFKKYPFTIFHCNSLWCILMWRFISPDCPKFFPHTWQLSSFILLWTMSTCLCIAVFWTNALPQWKQTKSFLFRCDFCACSTGLSRPGISNKWSIWTRDGRGSYFFHGAGQGLAKNLWGGPGRGTPPSPQCRAGRGRGQNLGGAEAGNILCVLIEIICCSKGNLN